MARTLSITPTPFKSSRLAIPPSPSSPRLPIVSTAGPTFRAPTRETLTPDASFPPPPPKPLHWMWQCHICRRVYPLAVTRRCLDDGHYFCSGATTVKRNRRTGKRKVVRHKACASEYDYQGWKNVGDWRRAVVEIVEAAMLADELHEAMSRPSFEPNQSAEQDWLSGSCTQRSVFAPPAQEFWHKDCWNNCDYPSECRWGKQLGAESPVAAPTSVPSSSPPPEPSGVEGVSNVTFDDILIQIGLAEATSAREDSAPLPATPETPTTQPTPDDALDSDRRRKRKSDGQLLSPLASNPPSPPSSAQRIDLEMENAASRSPRGSTDETLTARALHEREKFHLDEHGEPRGEPRGPNDDQAEEEKAGTVAKGLDVVSRKRAL